MANSSEDAPLATGSLAGSEEALVLPGRPRRDSNSRALKVAGLTTLACLLLASQIFTAYMVFGQKEQIHNLQRNSERMNRELTRSSQGPVKMTRSMSSLPMMMAFSADADYKPRATVNKVKETVVSVQNQVKELLQDFHLPHFNETFMANLNGLKNQMNETDWQSFETWMQFWLIFQMAQEKPATPTAKPTPVIKTKCQTEGATGPGKIGAYKPQCDEQGRYKPVQCWHATGFCWCVDSTGTAIKGTSMRGYPDCGRASTSRQMMLAPRMSQTAVEFHDN